MDFSTVLVLWSKELNSEVSHWPWVIPLTLWLSTFLWCKLVDQRRDFHKWYAIHNLHNGGAIFLGSLSIYYGTISNSNYNNDDGSNTVGLLNERIPILWSLTYFAVDTIDCVLRRDATYFAHAVFCFVLGYANYTTPILRQLRMNSKATYCELSNPFMHLAKRTRNPLHFTLFALVFTACRICWIPYLVRTLRNEGQLQWTDPILLVLAAFYALNLVWWVKILRILYNGLVGGHQEPPNDHDGPTPKTKET